jgi:hypothetical protein
VVVRHVVRLAHRVLRHAVVRRNWHFVSRSCVQMAQHQVPNVQVCVAAVRRLDKHQFGHFVDFWLVVCLVGRLVGRSVGWLVGCAVGWLADRQVGWLVCRLVGR